MEREKWGRPLSRLWSPLEMKSRQQPRADSGRGGEAEEREGEGGGEERGCGGSAPRGAQKGRSEDMDTPERGRIGPAAPASRFEDSPVFNFINSLSPIQPVKAVHSTQTFQSLTFASVSSIFSSPHVNLQKESRFLIRNPLSGSSKHEISSDIVDESGLSPGISNAIKLSNCTNVEQDNCNITCSLNEATVDPPDESSTICSNVPERMHYDCGSPNHNTVPFFAIKLDLAVDDCHTLSGPPQFDQDGGEKRKNLFSTEIELPIENQVGQDKEVGECDWENLISDELLIFDSSTESESCKGDEKLKEYDAKSLESLSSNIVDVITASHRTQSEVLFGPCLQNAAENHPVDQSGEVDEQHGTDCTPQILSATCQNQVTTSDQRQRTGKGASGCMSSGCKVDSKQPRGMRRRCLVFEVAGVSKKGLHNDSDLHPSISLSSNGKSACDDKQSVSLKPVNSPSPRILPGIGLHLNTLAATSKDRIGGQESLAAGKQLINTPCSISPFPPIIARHKRPIKSLDAENSLVPAGTEVLHDDASEAPAFEVGEESSQGSPKKKRRKPENGGESESCRRCNCKKSKCLKLYCECFAAGIYCMEPCACQGCFNKPIHQETVLATRKQIESRNPLAFAPKVIRAADSVQDEETNKTPASARHKRGCNCKKSSCLKKYCECYQGGVGCSESCRCEGCKNAFGRKYGIEEIEHEEKDIEVCEKEKEMPDEGQESANAKKSEQHLLESNLPITPFQICRPSVKLPFSSIGKPPRSSSLSVGYSVSQTLKRCDNRFPRHKTEKHAKAICEDDTPEILKGSASPSNGVKTASPNGKRVSPPHIGTRMSPNRKGGRKLILKSIPSFPSLNNDLSSEYAINYSENPFNSSPLS